MSRHPRPSLSVTRRVGTQGQDPVASRRAEGMGEGGSHAHYGQPHWHPLVARATEYSRRSAILVGLGDGGLRAHHDGHKDSGVNTAGHLAPVGCHHRGRWSQRDWPGTERHAKSWRAGPKSS